jgi:ATP-dependent DNA ligase
VIVAPAPMLARLEPRLPRGDQWRYEPKLDGFRGLLWRSADSAVRLLSRNMRDLSPWFPELVWAASALPCGTILDGEIVIASGGGLSDFGALQQRLTTARRATASAARECPAVLLTFDVLQFAGESLLDQPLVYRRQQLDQLLEANHGCLQRVDQTSHVELAEQWLSLVPGLEGVVAKRGDNRYLPGQRGWVKVKRQRSVDCIVIGLAGDPARPALVLGLRGEDGELHHFGICRPSGALEHPCAPVLEPIGPEQQPIRSRWQHDAVPTWRPVTPTAVAEVAYTLLDGGRWLRQPAKFLRWRFDKAAADCEASQLALL